MTDAVNKDARDKVIVRQLGKRTYEPVWQAMQTFTDQRTADDADEIWLVEHEPVFTQGQAGKAEHILMPGDIPVVQVDRGGQVTYHGPGQLVIYLMLNVRRRKMGDAADTVVNGCSSKFLMGYFFVGHGFDDIRSGDEHIACVFDHVDEVCHSR